MPVVLEESAGLWSAGCALEGDIYALNARKPEMCTLLSHTFTITIHVNLTTLFQLHASHNVRWKTDVNGKLEIGER